MYHIFYSISRKMHDFVLNIDLFEFVIVYLIDQII